MSWYNGHIWCLSCYAITDARDWFCKAGQDSQEDGDTKTFTLLRQTQLKHLGVCMTTP